jgi:hypothetical protein
VVRNLIVGPDSEKRSAERIVNAKATTYPAYLFPCDRSAIIGNDYRLNQNVQFQVFPAATGLFTNVTDGGVEPLSLPAHLVSLTVLKGPTEHRETDYVRMASRMSEGRLAVDADE